MEFSNPVNSFSDIYLDTVIKTFNNITGLMVESNCGFFGDSKDGKLPDYCKLICSTQTGLSGCKKNNYHILRNVQGKKEPFVYICHAGLIVGIVPITAEELPDKFMTGPRMRFNKDSGNTEKMISLISGKLKVPNYILLEELNKIPVGHIEMVKSNSELLLALSAYFYRKDNRPVKENLEHYKIKHKNLESWLSEDTILKAIKVTTVDHQRVTLEIQSSLIQKVYEQIIMGEYCEGQETFKILYSPCLKDNLNTSKAIATSLISNLDRAISLHVDYSMDLHNLYTQFLENMYEVDNIENLAEHLDNYYHWLFNTLYERESNNLLIQKMNRYIETNYPKKLKVEDIAQVAHISTSHACRLYKKITGNTIIEKINKVRLDRACDQLVHTNLNVNKIAQMIGFDDGRRFNKIFKSHYGIIPTEFRKYFK